MSTHEMACSGLFSSKQRSPTARIKCDLPFYNQKAHGLLCPSPALGLHCANLIADKVVANDGVAGRNVETFLHDVSRNEKVCSVRVVLIICH